MSLETIADRFFLNKYYLSHIFKDVTGYNYKQFVILSRLSKAKELLLNTGDSVQDIGVIVGFPNVSHFIRVFKATADLTPLQYRKKYSKS